MKKVTLHQIEVSLDAVDEDFVFALFDNHLHGRFELVFVRLTQEVVVRQVGDGSVNRFRQLRIVGVTEDKVKALHVTDGADAGDNQILFVIAGGSVKRLLQSGQLVVNGELNANLIVREGNDADKGT